MASQVHDCLVTFSGLGVAQGERRAVAGGVDGAPLAGDPVVFASDAHGVCSKGKKRCEFE